MSIDTEDRTAIENKKRYCKKLKGATNVCPVFTGDQFIPQMDTERE